MTENMEVAVRQAGQVSAIPDAREITALYKLGKAMANSGMFKDARQEFQAMTKLVLGRDLGLSATAAMTGIHLVEGRVELSSNLQAQMIRTWLGLGGERYDYDVEGPTVEGCAVTIYRVNPGVTYGDRENYEPLGKASFDKADALVAGLLSKDNWKKYPRNMYFARAMSNAIAFFCPEVTGGVRLYAPGEVSGDSDPGARTVSTVGDFEARAEAIREQEPQGDQPQAEGGDEDGIQDAHVVEDDTPALTPEQQAEQERLDQEFGETMPEFEEHDPPDPPGQQEPTTQTPNQESAEFLQRLVHQGLLEIGETDNVIAARLRGAGDNVVALQNLLKFIDNKKQQMEAKP